MNQDQSGLIHLFGAKTNCGFYFRENAKNNFQVFSYSRSEDQEYIKLNLENDADKTIFKENSICVSFAPIWKFSNFIKQKFYLNKNELKKIRVLLICSSSSSETKKYSSNSFDQLLNKNLLKSENVIKSICKELNIRLLIFRPTLIYGNFESYKDRNINKIIKLLKITPFIILPSESGLRQPIHFSQLSDCILKYCFNYENISLHNPNENILTLGGDHEMTYFDLIVLIRKELIMANKLYYFIIFRLPNRLFKLLFSPFILFSPKFYDAINRITVDLAGFTKSSKILNCKNKSFKFYV